jgi:hypothetical protein
LEPPACARAQPHITSKLMSFYQISCTMVMYRSKFNQLASNISWVKTTFMNQFQFGLCNDMKNLLLSTPNPTTLN